MKTFFAGLFLVALVLVGAWVFMNALQVWWPQTGYPDALLTLGGIGIAGLVWRGPAIGGRE